MFNKFKSLFINKKQQNEEDLAKIKSNLEGLTTDEIIGEREIPIAKSIITRQTTFSKMEPDPNDYHTYLQSILQEQYEEYIEFLKALREDEKIALAKPSRNRTTEDNELIERIFHKIPPLKHSFYAYRCYERNVSIADLQANPNNGVISSVTIRASYANWWCKRSFGGIISYVFKDEMPKQPNRKLDEKGDLIVCILIPKGTKIIPLIGNYLRHKEQEFETILSSHSKLYYTGIKIESKNIPLFVCVNEENLIDNTTEMKNMNKNMLTEYFIESAMQMDPTRRSSFIESFSRIPREEIIKKREVRERDERVRIEKEREDIERVRIFMENERIKAEEAEIEAQQHLQENISANYRNLTMIDGPRGGKKNKTKRHTKTKRHNKKKRNNKTKLHNKTKGHNKRKNK